MSLISETAAPAIARHTRNPPRGRGRHSTPAHLKRQRWKRGEWERSSTSPVGMPYLGRGTYHIFCYHIKKGNWHRTVWIYKLSQKWEPVIFSVSSTTLGSPRPCHSGSRNLCWWSPLRQCGVLESANMELTGWSFLNSSCTDFQIHHSSPVSARTVDSCYKPWLFSLQNSARTALSLGSDMFEENWGNAEARFGYFLKNDFPRPIL